MKYLIPLLVLCGVVTIAAPLSAQSPSSPAGRSNAESLKLLRQTVAEQARLPGKIIRTATDPTDPIAEEAGVVSASQADLPVFKRESPQHTPVSTKGAAAALLERQFLEGKLSDRQYKKALADIERTTRIPDATVEKSKSPAATRSPKFSTRGQLPPAAPDVPPEPPQPTVKQQKVSEAETKLDELIRQKEARDRAAQTNAIPVPAAGGTKRERLDFLLKQVVEGKISDEEYKKQREKILAEKE